MSKAGWGQAGAETREELSSAVSAQPMARLAGVQPGHSCVGPWERLASCLAFTRAGTGLCDCLSSPTIVNGYILTPDPWPLTPGPEPILLPEEDTGLVTASIPGARSWCCLLADVLDTQWGHKLALGRPACGLTVRGTW